LQFAITVILVIGTMVIYSQLDFLRSWDLGFDAEQVVVVPMPRPAIENNSEAIKAELSRSNQVIGISSSSDIPGGTDCRGLTARPDGSDHDISLPTVWVDNDFIKTLGINLVDGRDFTAASGVSPGRQLILNQSAVDEFGWKSAVDKQITIYTGEPGDHADSYTGSVVGVVEDYHFRYLEYGLQPLVLREGLRHARYLLVRIGTEDIQSTLAHIKRTITRFMPDQPFQYFFLDEYIQSLYDDEERFGRAVGYGCLLALMVSCLGLFGLASFVSQQRTKEIGIRKVVGASVRSIVLTLTREFVILVCVANVIAWPIAYLFLSHWLLNFRYRVDIELVYFVIAGIGTTLIALLAVAYKSLRAATVNPADVLKYE
jgi:putative ABC transport system permease protein